MNPLEENQLEYDLFPPLTPYASGFLQVDDVHEIYWEQSGNPEGVPILLLHGGPGAGAGIVHRQYFDPDFYRIIIFDQRGCGRSNPLGSIENNTAAHLVEDIEILRNHLQIESWHVFGGSWGSTLALHYACKYAAHIESMILRGIFLCEQHEIDWFLHGMGKIFPESHEIFTGILSKEEREKLLRSYYARLTHADPDIHMEAAICWTLYESACASLHPNLETITTEEQKGYALALARLESHYFIHEVIKPEDSFLKKIDLFRHIPTKIIQGRYDVICPIETAHRLHKAWPEAEYIVVPNAGHSMHDPPLRSRLIEACEQIKTAYET